MAKIQSFLKRFHDCSCFRSPENSFEVDPGTKIKSPLQTSASTPPDSPVVASTRTTSDTPTTKEKETVVLIAHGAFQVEWHYQLYMDAIRTYTTIDRAICPQQSSSNADPRADSFEHDVNLLNKTLLEELNQNNDVLLVCHSYGGIPGCEALTNLPTPIEGSIGKLLGIVFVSAFVADQGQSLITSKMAGRASWVRVEGPLSHINNPTTTLYNLVTPPSFATELSSHLVPQSSQSFLTPTKSANWKFHPCIYIRCLQDQAMLPREQDFFIARLLASDATEERQKTTRVKDLDADHAPFASMPKKLAEVTEEVVRELRDGDGEE